MKDYSFSPYNTQTGKLREGIYKAFVEEIEISGCDRIRGTIVYDNLRFTLLSSATLRQLLPKCKDKIKCRVSFQFHSDELVAVPKLDSNISVLYSSKLEEVFK